MSTVPPTMRGLPSRSVTVGDERVVAGIDAGGIGLKMKIAGRLIHKNRFVSDASGIKRIGKRATIVKFGADVIRPRWCRVVIQDGVVAPRAGSSEDSAAAVGGNVEDHGAAGDHPTINSAAAPGVVAAYQAIVEGGAVDSATVARSVVADRASDQSPAIGASTELEAELPAIVQLVRILAPKGLPPNTPPPSLLAVLLTTVQLINVQAQAPPP